MLDILIYSARLPLGMAQMCAITARHHHPDARIIHLTDMDGPGLEEADEVRRKPWVDGYPILLRLDHLCDLDDSPAVILDNDILVRGSLEGAFAGDFDMCFTRRETVVYETEPYNYGVQFSRCGEFHRRFRRRVEDQQRFKEFAHVQEGMTEEVKSGRWKVAELPCAIWNFSPGLKKPLQNQKILHYKGDRKPYMKAHFDAGVWR
jgi:hypothetical protein